jgi:hypothetical protein
MPFLLSKIPVDYFVQNKQHKVEIKGVSGLLIVAIKTIETTAEITPTVINKSTYSAKTLLIKSNILKKKLQGHHWSATLAYQHQKYRWQ